MYKLLVLTSVAALTAMSANLSSSAQAEESQARDWGLTNAELKRVDGTVVDVRCELAGDCPNNCGDGNRQLGIVDGDGKLYLAGKNNQTSFNGAVEDLLPYCGQAVEADGVVAGHSGVTIYHVQLIRPAGSEEWSKTTRWTKQWNAKNPELKEIKGPWFRKDPRITSRIEANGYFGLGKEVDQAYIDEWK